MMDDFLFVKQSNGLFTRVDSQGIVLVEACGGCSKIVTTGRHYLVNSTLGELEGILPEAHFCRVNRSCLVGMGHISGFTVESIYILDKEVALTKAYAEKFFERVKVVF